MISLKGMVNQTKARLISDSVDVFIERNINFFTKSFLIMLCVYVESYVKEIGEAIIKKVNASLQSSHVPNNLIYWSVKTNGDIENSKLEFSDFQIKLGKKELDDKISANPFRIAEFFKLLGINIEDDDIKDIVNTAINPLVGRRNSIIHYNDNASSVSLDDVLRYVDDAIVYIQKIDEKCE